MLQSAIRLRTSRTLIHSTWCLPINIRCVSKSSLRCTHYEVLGVSTNASHRDIKTAYLQRSKQHHPDLNPTKDGKSAEFNEINEAYRILSKPQTRKEYDFQLYRKANPADCPPPGSPLAKYWKDGTIYTGAEKYDPHKRPYKNSSIVIGAIAFAIIGGVLQLYIVKYFSEQRAEHAELVHQNALASMRKREALRKLGKTELQLALIEHERKKTTDEPSI